MHTRCPKVHHPIKCPLHVVKTSGDHLKCPEFTPKYVTLLAFIGCNQLYGCVEMETQYRSNFVVELRWSLELQTAPLKPMFTYKVVC